MRFGDKTTFCQQISKKETGEHLFEREDSYLLGGGKEGAGGEKKRGSKNLKRSVGREEEERK